MTQANIDGFEVKCIVTPLENDRFSVGIGTCPMSLESGMREWSIPGGRSFESSDEAMRYGRYVLLGIQHVDRDGKPLFTVV